MSSNTATLNSDTNVWHGGQSPFAASYGKLMMWFFLLSDAFTFSGLLVVYGFFRFSHPGPADAIGTDMLTNEFWPLAENVFNAYPLGEALANLTGLDIAHQPNVFVAIMTFILILSSVTMILAVEAGHRMDRKDVEKWMLWTLVGGITFLACQAWEWSHFIHGTPAGSMIEYIYNGEVIKDTFYGANLSANQYGPPVFAQLFFFITGFHGTHVFSGVILNFIVFYNTVNGVYDKRGHYEMVEKVGLYWHFVDLVWVFVFTFFYLV